MADEQPGTSAEGEELREIFTRVTGADTITHRQEPDPTKKVLEVDGSEEPDS